MSNNTVALFNGQVIGEIVAATADGEHRLLRLTQADAARFLDLAGIGCAIPPTGILVEIGDADVAYLRGEAARPADEMIRVAHLHWDGTHGNEPETVSTFLVR